MVYLSKIYTKTGDGGTTHLASGQVVSKNSPRVRAYGEMDELNASVGWARAVLAQHHQAHKLQKLDQWLMQLQRELFDAGAVLATLPADLPANATGSLGLAASRLEKQIDEMNTQLSPLPGFVLPGPEELNAALHLARTVCRRAEREVVALQETGEAPGAILIFLNRLSDFLFVAARWSSKQLNTPEELWQPTSQK